MADAIVLSSTGNIVITPSSEPTAIVIGGMSTPGAQGIPGPAGPAGSGITNLAQAADVNMTNLTNGSILVYKLADQSWVATTLLDTQTVDAGFF